MSLVTACHVPVNNSQQPRFKSVNGSPLNGSSVPSCKQEALGRLMELEEELVSASPASNVSLVTACHVPVNPVQCHKSKFVNGSPLSGSSVPSCKREALGRLTLMGIEEELVSSSRRTCDPATRIPRTLETLTVQFEAPLEGKRAEVHQCRQPVKISLKIVQKHEVSS